VTAGGTGLDIEAGGRVIAIGRLVRVIVEREAEILLETVRMTVSGDHFRLVARRPEHRMGVADDRRCRSGRRTTAPEAR
jgi:hypothetical protein